MCHSPSPGVPEHWRSERLVFRAFAATEASIARGIFNAGAHLRDRDPTFGEYDLQEFEQLIDRDQTHVQRNGEPRFYLRAIIDANDNSVVGYVQIEIDAPEQGHSWIPMLVLKPSDQGRGIGREVARSIAFQLEALGIVDVGLNVYAENPAAVRFWFRCGFREILDVELEEQHGKNYTCLTLRRKLIRSGEYV
tara:strand:+ start:4595 stop:5173 length:579 start_codon:yes stop_codon:yes gene_type:complete